MPFVSADDGCEIYYEIHGEGPAVAFCSGFMGITGKGARLELDPVAICRGWFNGGAV